MSVGHQGFKGGKVPVPRMAAYFDGYGWQHMFSRQMTPTGALHAKRAGGIHRLHVGASLFC